MPIKSDIPTLLDAICENFMLAFPGHPWSPKIGEDMQMTTYCNLFVNGVARSLGYFSFWLSSANEAMTANQICDFVSSSTEWTKVAGDVAQSHANNGSFVIAAQKADDHGHVNVVRPGNMVFSAHWNKQAPKCVNVGKTVALDQGENWAFQNEPDFFVLNSTVS